MPSEPAAGPANDLESQLAALEQSAATDEGSLERLRALLAEGYLRNLLARLETLKAEADGAERRAQRAQADADDARRLLAEEEERLLKLWDAYRAQERELAAARAETEDARAQLDATKASMGATEARVAEKARDLEVAEAEIRRLEERLASFDAMKGQLEELAALRERTEDAERKLKAERERLAKLYAAYEEVEADRDRLKKELDERTAWFAENKEAFDQLVRNLRRTSPPKNP